MPVKRVGVSKLQPQPKTKENMQNEFSRELSNEKLFGDSRGVENTTNARPGFYGVYPGE